MLHLTNLSSLAVPAPHRRPQPHRRYVAPSLFSYKAWVDGRFHLLTCEQPVVSYRRRRIEYVTLM